MMNTNNKKEYRRLLAILQKAEGRTFEDIAKEHGVSSRSVQRWVGKLQGIVYIKGKTDFITAPSSGKATYTFQAIGNYGIALFNSNATGNLSFLSDTVAVYKVDMNSNGTNTFTMWKWGK